MSTHERSFGGVLQDIVGNVQDIVRSEVRLARTELREEAAKAGAAGTLIGVGAVLGVFGAAFLLLAIVYGLATIMPAWGAALVVGAPLALAAALAVHTGLSRLKRVSPVPDKTIRSIAESVSWPKPQSR